jgi:lysophospholipase L1-like esterase
MGTNGIVTEADLKPILDSLSDRRRVVVVNVQVPRVWMKPSNKVINSLVKNYPNVRLVDWYTASKGHRGYFVADGVHLTFKGAHVMATLIKQALEAD